MVSYTRNSPAARKKGQQGTELWVAQELEKEMDDDAQPESDGIMIRKSSRSAWQKIRTGRSRVRQ